MRNEIKELAGGNEWRIFTSRFYADYLSVGASDHDSTSYWDDDYLIFSKPTN